MGRKKNTNAALVKGEGGEMHEDSSGWCLCWFCTRSKCHNCPPTPRLVMVLVQNPIRKNNLLIPIEVVVVLEVRNPLGYVPNACMVM